MTAVHADTTNFQCSPYGVTGEQLVVGRNTSELNHSELEYEVVDALLSHSLSQIREMCDHVLWLDSGEVKMYGETQEVCDAYSI